MLQFPTDTFGSQVNTSELPKLAQQMAHLDGLHKWWDLGNVHDAGLVTRSLELLEGFGSQGLYFLGLLGSYTRLL